jgi:hypothetical protein
MLFCLLFYIIFRICGAFSRQNAPAFSLVLQAQRIPEYCGLKPVELHYLFGIMDIGNKGNR